uniref:hypothetical protein n=1 Tax=Candidatus Nitrotoga sp. M5 TaxID=2890409 RepID=UPI001EF1730C|nr:hypothetical protein [Candidatus Nitrotoga sp. M5]
MLKINPKPPTTLPLATSGATLTLAQPFGQQHRHQRIYEVPSALARATRLAWRLRGRRCIKRTGSALSPCRVGFGMGFPIWAHADIQAGNASRALRTASVSVSPSDMQPGRSGKVIR